MDRQHVKLIRADEPVDNAVWRVHDLADQRILEFRNRSTDSANETNRPVAAMRREMTTDA